VIAYPVTTHCTAAAEKPNSRSMDGSATFTMLKSSTTMKAATRISARPSPLCSATDAAGRRWAAASAQAAPRLAAARLAVRWMAVRWMAVRWLAVRWLGPPGLAPGEVGTDRLLLVVVSADMTLSHIRYVTSRF
jgi:hypothetical protein